MKIFKKWGSWIDLSISRDQNENFYILQARRREDGKIQLRVERNLWGCYGPTELKLEDLEKVRY